MLDGTVLILLDSKANRHSTNALLGALDTAPELDELEVRLAADELQLARHIEESLDADKQAIVGVSFTTPRLHKIRDIRSRHTDQRCASVPGAGSVGTATMPTTAAQRCPAPTTTEQVLWLAGGPHPTADPEGTLGLGFDIVVRGEGEATFLDLLRTVMARGELADVPGIAFRAPSGGVRFTGRRAPVTLDAYPSFPSRRRKRIGPIEITRGCPFACGYCQTSHLLGTTPRHRSIESIVGHASIIARRSPCDVRVVTPNAFSYGSPDGKTLDITALQAMLTEMRRVLGSNSRLFFGTFPSEVRPEHVNDDTLALVKRYANNDSLVIGAQSGSDRVLAHCGRGHTVSDVLRAVSQTTAAGLTPLVDFIFGLPGETPEDVKETIRVIRELAAIGARIHAHTFMPLPQTRFAGQPPGRIPGRLRLAMKELIRGGHLFGVWPEQEREARRMAQAPSHASPAP